MEELTLPSFIDARKFQYIKVDNQYIIHLMVKAYPEEVTFLEIPNKIPKDYEYEMNILIEKKDLGQELKNLTYTIASSGTELKTTHQNQIDIDVIERRKQNAKKIRRDIYINHDEIYNMNILFCFYSCHLEKLQDTVKDFQNKLFAKQIQSIIPNFRQLECYQLTLPFQGGSHRLLEQNEQLITTSSLVYQFFLYHKSLLDKNGIFLGYTSLENKLCSINLFDTYYTNANMCILGSSGTGKSFFSKLLLLREYIKGENILVFDPEGEYVKLAKKLQGIVLEIANNNPPYYKNLLDIEYWEIKNEPYFLNEQEKESLTKAIKCKYFEYGITEKIDSVFKIDSIDRIYLNKQLKEKNEIPNLNEILQTLNKKTSIYQKLKKWTSLFPVYANTTNMNKENNFIVLNLQGVPYALASNIIKFELEYYMKRIQYLANNKENKNTKHIILMDEIWKYLYLDQRYELGNTILMLYKTIRKYHASIITVTQDISDFFSIEEGKYGKSIMNNAGFKMFFRLEYAEDTIKHLSNIKKNDMDTILSLEKAEAMLCIKNNKICLKIQANKFEKDLIEEELNEDFIGNR